MIPHVGWDFMRHLCESNKKMNNYRFIALFYIIGIHHFQVINLETLY